VIETFQQLWQQLLDLVSKVVIPDWGALIGLLPTLLLIGLLGPLVSLGLLAWVVYVLAAPRRRLAPEPGPVAAVIVDGRPVFPPGEPYCPTHRLVHPFGAGECAVDRAALVLVCPKCGGGRSAHQAACAACGLELRLTARPRLAPVAPPPGGAAAA
jgi:hypothetical protein